MNLVKEAHRLHSAGYDLIPLQGKRPTVKGWTNAPRLVWDELESRLTDNVGIRLGQPLPDGRFLACIDVDVVQPLSTAEHLKLRAAIEAVVGKSDTPEAVTGFGNASRHLYVATALPAKTTKLAQADRQVRYSKDGKEKQGPVWTVELRGLGAQTVLPPSVHPDTQAQYKWKRRLNGSETLPLVIAPLQQEPKLEESSSHIASTMTPVSELSIAPLYRQILMTGNVADYPSRSEALYAVISVLVRDTKLSDDQIEQLILSQPLGQKAEGKPAGWIAKQCIKLRTQPNVPLQQLRALEPGASVAQLRPILEAAARLGMSPIEREEFLDTAKQISGLSKQALTEELDLSRGDASAQRARLAHGDPVYEEVLRRHFLVSWAGKPAVFRERVNPPAWESRYDVMTLSALATFYENKPVLVGRGAANPVEMWRADPQRREFLEGVRFVPPDEACPQGVFNLWQGFAFEPKRSPVDLWREFIRNVICHGNESYASWLEDWVADAFQHPGKPQGVAVVLRGAEGIGKGTFASALGRIFGSHFRHVTQESQLTGRFNAHFADSALIYADELVWGGDKKHRGTLYALVSEEYFMVERKNFDSVPMRNLNRMIIASNNDWVVPTGLDGRRWFVLDVSDRFKGDTAYFKRIRKWLEEGGYEAILAYYLQREITHDLRKAPVTEALIEQKVSGFDSVTAWWSAVLDRGCMRPPIGDAVSSWDTRLSKELVRLSYKAFCDDHGVKPAYWGSVVKRWQKLVPELKETRIREGEKRVQIMELPSLEQCQDYFQKLLGFVTD